MPTGIMESPNFKVGYARNIPGDMGIIVIGLPQTMLGCLQTALAVRQGIHKGTKQIIEMAKDMLLEKGISGERIGKHKGEDLYHTGALRASVKGTVSGKVIRPGATITGILKAGSKKVWYAYKVHEIGRGPGYWKYGVKSLFERLFAQKKQVGVVAKGGFRHPPIPYMQLAWKRVRPSAVPIMTRNIYNSLSELMSILGGM